MARVGKKWTEGGHYKMSDGREIREDQIDQRFQLPLHQTFRPEVVRASRPQARPIGDDGPSPLLAKPPAWTRRDMPCVPPREVDPDVARKHMDQWDVRVGAGPGQARPARAAAQALCAGCPVINQCLSGALLEERGTGRQYRHLVRGGLLPMDRATLDRREDLARMNSEVE